RHLCRVRLVARWRLQGTRCVPAVYCLCPGQVRRAASADYAKSGFRMGAHFFPFGPHEPSTRLIPSIVRSLLRLEPAQCTPGGHVRDFLYVEDLRHAFAALVDIRLQGPVNLAWGG